MQNVNCLDLVLNHLFIYQIYSFIQPSNANHLTSSIIVYSNNVQLDQFIFYLFKPKLINYLFETYSINRWWIHQLFYSRILNSRTRSSSADCLSKNSFDLFFLNFTAVFVHMLDVALKLFILTGASTFMGKNLFFFFVLHITL